MSTNVPLTVWSPSDGNGEYTVGASSFLVDPVTPTSFIVDPAGTLASPIFEVDTGVTLTTIPQTVWQERDDL